MYQPRIADKMLASKLRSSGGIIMEGAKACGKTATATQQARTIHRVDVEPNLAELLKVAPDAVVHGDSPILFDEWQQMPDLWNVVRRAIDDRRQPGQFIMCGLSTPADDAQQHSGLGRFAHIQLRPMTAWERGVFPGGIKLSDLMRGAPIQATTSPPMPAQSILTEIIHGGWPADFDAPLDQATDHVSDYLYRLETFEMPNVSGTTKRNLSGVRTLLRSIARNVAGSPSVRTLTGDVRSQVDSVDRTTVEEWINALERMFILERQRAWEPKLRSKARLRSSDVLHLVDSSLTARLLGATPQRLLGDLETAGLLFESFVFQQLLAFAAPFNGEILHYRDSNGYELDQVVVDWNNHWLPIEVKLGQGNIEKGVTGLLKAVAQIDQSVVGQPATPVLIVGGTDLSYYDRRGVNVVALQTLEP